MILTKQIRQKIKDYHEYHGDKNIKIIRVIKDADGYDAVLVHVNGDTSCLDVMDGDGDFSELYSCATENEIVMVERFESGGEREDAYSDEL
jgi:hypothetical protein